MTIGSDDSIEKYRANLRHVVRPEDPADRADSDRVLFDDWLALWAADAFRAYAAYDAPSSTHEDVAIAYAQYAEHVVRNEGKANVFFYAHTVAAREVLHDAFDGTASSANHSSAAAVVSGQIPEP